jgi:acyl carrier protein
MGELYIGGTGLARGYLNRPAMTAEKFVPHPFSADPGARLYKTGDQARYQPDGNLEFLGRRDHQVKLRGYRVELGEIEAVLSGHPAVDEAVMLVREETPEDQRLVAYVVSPQGVTPHDLRQHLKQTLPEYMVPAHFVMLDAFPLTPSGKVDRKALPIPDESRTLLETAFVAPRTPTEGQLAKIWQEVLKLDKVGTQDNFFELGGHSLLATQVLSRVRRALDVDVPLRAFFENPTVAGLAEVVAHLETVPGRSSAIALILEKIGAMDAGEIHDLLNEKKKKAGL